MINNSILRKERFFYFLSFLTLALVALVLSVGLGKKNFVSGTILIYVCIGCFGWSFWMLFLLFRGSKRALVYISENCSFGACIMELPGFPEGEEMLKFTPLKHWIIVVVDKRASGYTGISYMFYSSGKDKKTKYGELPVVNVYSVDDE